MKRRGSLRRKITVVVMTTTAVALLVSAASLLLYELRSYRDAWVNDLTTQAELVANSVGAALTFNDAAAASENLALLRLRPQIESAAVYRASGERFASYASAEAHAAPPPTLASKPTGSDFEGDRLTLVQPVMHGSERLGTVVLVAHHDVGGRIVDYLAILAAVTLASMALAALIFSRLQHGVTEPILAVAQTARDVVQRRDFDLKVPRQSDDEMGVLVDAFNDMLASLSTEIGQRRRAEDALRLADRRKDEFLAMLAHELRNPLAPLLNGLELLRDPRTEPDVQERARNIMGRQLQQMVRLIEDLLDVSRITTDRLELRRDPHDLRDVLRDAIEVVDPVMRERGHTLVTQLPEQPVWVEADATRLAQVFVNLLNNAAKYTDPNGRVVLAARADDGRAVVSVSDNGVGIDPALQGGIFEMFVQADPSIERGRAGLGVGLTLARKLVELHGGTIGVKSAGIGQGSEFTITLPLIAAPAQAPAVARRLSDAHRRVAQRTPLAAALPSVPSRGVAGAAGPGAAGAATAPAPTQAAHAAGDATKPAAPATAAPPPPSAPTSAANTRNATPAASPQREPMPIAAAPAALIAASSDARAAAGGPAPGPTATRAAPRSAVASSGSAARAAAERRRAPAGGLRVLIADDNLDLATSLGDVLGSLGHKVSIVHDGHAALEAATSQPFDVALFDIGMPGLNGYELARRVRASETARDLLMVAVTGFGQQADRERTADAGFNRHMVKPVAPRELIEFLDAHARRLEGGEAPPGGG
ncbi:hybrid sensor histidine kinase/response regulator [Piscinibacter koreensis]|uniref:histidine kinase n=1 Tax=Piscinibacter koreensis TaxID=2742824 RepID=A0A7Y6NLR2_9BURK|nr:ATP-binding protein [Schlegelella koreensis]NUZ05533.1 response regulator [Schlegelella koreensis]